MDEKTRTVKVRAEVENPKGELKPEMYADVTIHARSRTVLQVPDDAILESGTRSIAFVDQGAGSARAARGRASATAGTGWWRSGAASPRETWSCRGANFLVDSESRLKAAIAAMGASK